MKKFTFSVICILAASLLLTASVAADSVHDNRYKKDFYVSYAPLEETRYFIVTGVDAATGDPLVYDIRIARKDCTGEEMAREFARTIAKQRGQTLDAASSLDVQEIMDPMSYGERFISKEERLRREIQELQEKNEALEQENRELRFENRDLKQRLEEE